MTTPTNHADARGGLTLLLGPRQADLMRLLWAHSQATLRQLQQWLAESDLAYTTIATHCARLVEKGLLRQQRIEESDQRDCRARLYTPLLSQEDFVRAAVEHQLDGLLAHYPDLVCSYVTEHIQHTGASVPADRTTENNTGRQDEQDRIEIRNSKLKTQNLELAAAQWEAEARRAQHQAKLATARYERAEARTREWEATARRATAQALAAEEEADTIIRRVALQQHAAARSAPEFYVPSGVCRVCNAPVSEVSARRRDGLRVCAEEMCRQEARRRDHAAKQRQQRARWRTRREQVPQGG
jgi:predicted transcriptional regulator